MGGRAWYETVRFAWATRVLDWFLFRSKVVLVLICIGAGLAFGFLATFLSRLLAGSVSEQVVYILVLGLAVAFLLFVFAHGVIRLIGEKILLYVSGPDALRQMLAGDLENLTVALFEKMGQKVRRRALPGKPDGGIDLEVLRDGKWGLVQCKKWTHESVGVDKVRELFGVMADRGADFGVFVTTSQFTEEAEKFAHGKSMELIDHAALWRLVQEQQFERKVEELLTTPKIEVVDKKPLECPRCGDVLVLRNSYRGEFLGCNSYSLTGCGTIVPVERARGAGVDSKDKGEGYGKTA